MDNKRRFASPAVTAYPTSDGLVFSENKFGYIFERRGVITMFHDSELREDVFYSDEYGNVWGERDEDLTVLERYTPIGKVGDTIVPKQLEMAILANTESNNAYVGDIFHNAEKYFTIDKTKAEDVLRVRMGLIPFIDGEISLYVDSEYYGFGSNFHFNVNNEDFKSEDRDYNMYDAFILPLAFYRRYLGKEISIDIDFNNETYCGCSPETIKADNERIDAFRQKHLQRIRDYIKDMVEAALYEEKTDYGKYKEYETLNQDGKLITI